MIQKESDMCLICDRIEMIKNGTNPWFVRELETGYVVIGDKQYFRGYCLFLCKWHETELFSLDEEKRVKFLLEMSAVAEAVKLAFGAEKMNYELLGNGDSHIHWHLFPRRKGDLENDGIDYGKNGSGPVWWIPWNIMNHEKYKIGGDELEKMKNDLLAALDKVLAKQKK